MLIVVLYAILTPPRVTYMAAAKAGLIAQPVARMARPTLYTPEKATQKQGKRKGKTTPTQTQTSVSAPTNTAQRPLEEVWMVAVDKKKRRVAVKKNAKRPPPL